MKKETSHAKQVFLPQSLFERINLCRMYKSANAFIVDILDKNLPTGSELEEMSKEDIYRRFHTPAAEDVAERMPIGLKPSPPPIPKRPVLQAGLRDDHPIYDSYGKPGWQWDLEHGDDAAKANARQMLAKIETQEYQHRVKWFWTFGRVIPYPGLNPDGSLPSIEEAKRQQDASKEVAAADEERRAKALAAVEAAQREAEADESDPLADFVPIRR